MSNQTVEALSTAQSSSARARKRQRKKANQKARSVAALEESLAAMAEFPSVANAFRAWLAYLHRSGSTEEYKSAANFSRVFQHVVGSRREQLCETQRLTSNFFTYAQGLEALTIHPVDKNIERPSKISRVGSNLGSFVWFLGKYRVLPLSEVQSLHEYCSDLGASLIRSVRAERVGESYATFTRTSYVDSGLTEGVQNYTLFKGGFEIAYVGKRFCLLQDWKESGLNHRAFEEVEPVKVRCPAPMTKQLKPGDHLHLEIRKMKDRDIWVPTECYGVYPEGASDDEGEDAESSIETAPASQRRSQEKSSEGGAAERIDDQYSALSDAYRDLHIHEEASHSTSGGARSGQTSEKGRTSRQRRFTELQAEDVAADDFDERRYTDSYFAAMELDIGDDDRGFGAFEGGDSDGQGDETE